MKKNQILKISTSNNFEQQLQKRLEGGQFRLLNEKIYKNEKLTNDQIIRYHDYYRKQIKKWPIDPNKLILEELSTAITEIDIFIKNKIIIIKNHKIFHSITPYNEAINIADIGAGDSTKYNDLIEIVLKTMQSSVNFEFFDKYPINKNIIQADIESIPRQCKTFNIVVCCLSMIKNDISNIIKEVNRILKIKGIFLFAELKSRIKNISIFTNNIKKYGFKVKNINSQNKCFIICKFEKIHDIEKKKLQSLKLNNYLYKKK